MYLLLCGRILPEYWWGQLLAFYIWLLLAAVLGGLALCRFARLLRKLAHPATRRLFRRVLAYPYLFAFVFVWPCASRVYQWVSPAPCRAVCWAFGLAHGL